MFSSSQEKRPRRIEILKSLVRDGAILRAVDFNILTDTPSGPLALFTSKDLMYVRTSLVVQSSSCGQVEYRMSYPPPLPFEGDIGGTVVLKQAVNIPLSIVAFSLIVSAVVAILMVHGVLGL